MKCPNCGHEVREGLSFCTNCGARLPRTGQTGIGGAQQPEPARRDICPKCGSVLPEGSAFCPNCGTPVGGGQAGSQPDPSRTQPMPVLSQNPPRVEAVPSPPQESYSTRGSSKGPHGGNGSKAPLIVAVAVIAAAVVIVAVMAALGAGPFQGSADPNDSQTATEVTNGSVAVEDNQNGNTSNSNAGNASSANESASNANATSNANASQNGNAAGSNTNANASNSSNTSDASNSSNANATNDGGTSGSVSLSGGYVSNSNSTYGYSLRVPTSFTLSGSDSAGNATLTDTASPCVITVSVDDNPNGYTVDQALANASAGSSSNAYTAEGNGWYVFSDEPNDSVYYVMSYVQQGRTISLRFSYPAAAKSQCDPIIESVQPTFSVN